MFFLDYTTPAFAACLGAPALLLARLRCPPSPACLMAWFSRLARCRCCVRGVVGPMLVRLGVPVPVLR